MDELKLLGFDEVGVGTYLTRSVHRSIGIRLSEKNATIESCGYDDNQHTFLKEATLSIEELKAIVAEMEALGKVKAVRASHEKKEVVVTPATPSMNIAEAEKKEKEQSEKAKPQLKGYVEACLSKYGNTIMNYSDAKIFGGVGNVIRMLRKDGFECIWRNGSYEEIKHSFTKFHTPDEKYYILEVIK